MLHRTTALVTAVAGVMAGAMADGSRWMGSRWMGPSSLVMQVHFEGVPNYENGLGTCVYLFITRPARLGIA